MRQETRERIEQVAKLVTQGRSYVAACKEIGISPQTFRKYRDEEAGEIESASNVRTASPVVISEEGMPTWARTLQGRVIHSNLSSDDKLELLQRIYNS